MDLVANRLEPLIKENDNCPDPEDIPPAILIPYYRNKGINSSQQLLKFVSEQKQLLIGGVSEVTQSELNQWRNPEQQPPREKRYDFMV
jgi:hypothetical protein